MRILLITLFAVLASITSTSFANCPPQLSAGDMLECITVEGNDDLSYQEWAAEFYKSTNPEKAAAIRAAYKAETKSTKNNVKGNTLSLSQ